MAARRSEMGKFDPEQLKKGIRNGRSKQNARRHEEKET
jgi:hypothetical protein